MTHNNAGQTITATTTAVRTGREYLRVSLDKSGRGRSVAEQHEDNVRRAGDQGITINGDPYVDNGISASLYATKARGDFARLVADLESGAFGADVLIIWESSRGSRKAAEWCSLIDLCAAQGVLIFVTSDGRIYDPADGRDRRTLQEDAVDSEYESYKISKRIRRDTAAQAAAGRPHGIAPHGYRPVYDQKTGKLLNWVEDENESAVPKTLFRRLHAGHSLSAITRDLKAAGHLNRSGKPFTQQHLRAMATKHAYAGLRAHTPRSRGQKASTAKPQVVPATWAPLIADSRDKAQELFWAVQSRISDPSRRTSRDGKAKHALSRIIKCGVCGDVMRIGTQAGGARHTTYKCASARACTTVRLDDADALLIGTADAPGLVLAYLASDKVYADFAAAEKDTAAAERAAAKLAKARAELAEVNAAEPESLIEARFLAKTAEKLTEDIAKLEEEKRTHAFPDVLSAVMAPGADVAQRWADAPVTARREVARLLLTPGVLGEVHIVPTPRRGKRVPAAERIELRRAPVTPAPDNFRKAA